MTLNDAEETKRHPGPVNFLRNADSHRESHAPRLHSLVFILGHTHTHTHRPRIPLKGLAVRIEKQKLLDDGFQTQTLMSKY